jgi:hypothetical protein
MGLDMYLKRHIYVKNWEHTPPEKKFKISVIFNNEIYKGVDSDKISYIVEDVAYWRKANQIHNWFVENVQEGVDNCGDYYVSREKLKELVALCKTVVEGCELVEGEVCMGTSYKDGKAHKIMEKGKIISNSEIAEALLPTSSGFFFGSYEYNEWYLQDLKDTIEQLTPYLSDDIKGHFVYSSSW